jgi:hypothetical protein
VHQILPHHAVRVEKRGVESDALSHDVHPHLAIVVKAGRDEMLEFVIQIGV